MSYDIALVSSGYDMTIRFWSEISSGTQCKYTVEHKDNAINALEMTPAKDKVAFASGNSIKFLDSKNDVIKLPYENCKNIAIQYLSGLVLAVKKYPLFYLKIWLFQIKVVLLQRQKVENV